MIISETVEEANVALENSSLERFNPFHPEYRANPYAVYRVYRAQDPVHWGASPEPEVPGCWYLTRYADAASALKDPRLGLEFYRILPPEALPQIPQEFMPYFQMIGQWMIFRDPPTHTRLRQLVNKAFTPRMIERLRPFVEEVADELLNPVQNEGSMDIIAQLAFPLPVIVIAKMLGVPTENRENLKDWSSAILDAIDLRQSKADVAAIYGRATQATLEFTAYLRSLIAERRDHLQDDLLSSLISAEEEGDKLSEDELIATCTLLLWAGHETTVNLIGNGMHALLKHPDQLRKLMAHPELIDTAVEEIIRYDCPAQMTFRFAFEDIEMGDKVIRKGDSVAIVFGAANRDPEQFSEPDRFDITRTDNRHLGFGTGGHYCLGAALARVEGKVAITRLLRRMPQLKLQTEEADWNESIGLRGLKSLPVYF